MSWADIQAFQAVAADSPIPGYTIEALEWDVHVAPGQVHVQNGTIQEVFVQALQINPDFKRTDAVRVASSSSTPRRGLHEHMKRAVNCGTWPLANKQCIEEGIAYLRTVPAAPRNGPGPGNCGRVSCSHNSTIYWCNDVSSVPLKRSHLS